MFPRTSSFHTIFSKVCTSWGPVCAKAWAPGLQRFDFPAIPRSVPCGAQLVAKRRVVRRPLFPSLHCSIRRSISIFMQHAKTPMAALCRCGAKAERVWHRRSGSPCELPRWPQENKWCGQRSGTAAPVRNKTHTCLCVWLPLSEAWIGITRERVAPELMQFRTGEH